MWTHLPALQSLTMYRRLSTTFTFDDLRLSFPRLRAKQTHRQGSYHFFLTDKESMVEQNADGTYIDPRLQSLRREYTAVWQRVLNSSPPTGEEAERLPLGVSSTHPQHHLAG